MVRYPLLAGCIGLLIVKAWASSPLTNYKSGISLTVAGTQDVDYAFECFYYDTLADDHGVIYIKDNAEISFTHNARNVIFANTTCNGGSRIIGVNGPDGTPHSGDEGAIIFKIDRDRASYNYKSYTGNAFLTYTTPFAFNELTFETGVPVVGTVGPSGTGAGVYYRGMLDAAGDEWHILTYWDNDAYYTCLDGRASLSDAKIMYFVVNPKTPLISFTTRTAAAQFYTTPAKAYFTPVIYDQTTYLTDDVDIELVNIMGGAVYYKVDNGSFVPYTAAISSNILSDGEHTIEYYYDAAHHKTRKLVKNPDYPSNADVYPDGSGHGFLMWSNTTEQSYIKNKINNREPYKTSYYYWHTDSYYGLSDTTTQKYPLAVRPIWRGWPGAASAALNNIAQYIFANTPGDYYARTAKKALLDLFVVDPVGGEQNGYETYAPAPSNDRLDIPNSGVLPYVNAGLAYDLLVGNYKKTTYANGVTPIEDFKIRDNLASQAFVMLLSANMNCGNDGLGCWGSGDMHYALGFEEIATGLGLAMPSYSTPYYGTSGFDLVTTVSYTNTPYPDQAFTWFEVLTDSGVVTQGRPNLYSKARYFTAFKYFNQFTDAYPANGVLPKSKHFWVAANAFTCCKGMYPEGTSVGSMPDYGCMAVAFDFDCGALGLTKVNTISGTVCQKGGWNRSFNMPGDCIAAADRMYHVEYDGYEAPFIPNAIILNNIFKRKYGVPVAASVEQYISVKIDRIAGNFDTTYLKQSSTGCGTCFNSSSNENEFTFNNSQSLVCALPLCLYNPVNPLAKRVVHIPKQFMTTYAYFRPKKMEPSITEMIFYEDDTTRYTASAMTDRFTLFPETGEINCYPDPFVTVLRVDLNIPEKQYTLDVYSAKGQVVTSVRNRDYLVVDHLKPGVYFVGIQTGRHTVFKKVMKIAP